jgi:hypothetical protein
MLRRDYVSTSYLKDLDIIHCEGKQRVFARFDSSRRALVGSRHASMVAHGVRFPSAATS